MRISTDKKISKLVRKRLRSGWRFIKGRKHGKLVAPDGRRFIVPCTPSDYRAFRNFRGDLRRNHV